MLAGCPYELFQLCPYVRRMPIGADSVMPSCELDGNFELFQYQWCLLSLGVADICCYVFISSLKVVFIDCNLFFTSSFF